MKSSALDTLRESAARLGISEYDVSDVRRSPSFAVKERQRLYGGQEYTLDLLSRVKVEFAILDEDAKQVAQNILTLVAPDTIAISALDEVHQHVYELRLQRPAFPHRGRSLRHN
jgi:nitrogen regulatory protein PII